MEFKSAINIIQADNDRICVTKWILPPKSETGHHVHKYDYVIVPIKGGDLTIYENKKGATTAPIVSGESYFRRAGVSHNVTNQGDAQIEFVEIEIKP